MLLALKVSGLPLMKLPKLIYRKLITSAEADLNRQSREVVLNWLLVGIFCLTFIAFGSSLVTFIFLDHSYVRTRLIGVSLGLSVIIASLYLFKKKRMHALVSAIIVLFFYIAGTLVLYTWGILTPTGVLLFSLTVVMAGILISARSSLYLVAITGLTLGLLEYAKAHGHVAPDISWMRVPSNPSDVFVFSSIYAILGISTWLFNRQMEQSLGRAQRAETALQKQNESLEIKVAERTRELEREQLERMQQMYRFAELGRVSTALFHDLANHVSTVSVDIENLQRGRKSDILERIDENVRYIDTIMKRVRSQMQGRVRLERFNLEEEVKEVVKVSTFAADSAKVGIELRFPTARKTLHYTGDILRFRQVIMNLLANAIDAYKNVGVEGDLRTVLIDTQVSAEAVIIRFTDYGEGIPAEKLPKIFDPFFTSKDKGVGIGLFIVRQVVENDFNGSVLVESTKQTGTTFTVILPLGKGHGSGKA